MYSKRNVVVLCENFSPPKAVGSRLSDFQYKYLCLLRQPLQPKSLLSPLHVGVLSFANALFYSVSFGDPYVLAEMQIATHK